MNQRTITDAAIALHNIGANVLPLRLPDGTDDSKRPTLPFKRWTTRPQNADDVARMFYRHEGNIGALGGIHSDAIPDAGYLAYVDCDSARAFDMVGGLIHAGYGDTRTAKTLRGGHYWIRTDEPIKTHPFNGGELRGRGAYVAAPPSLHPSGIEYKWIDADAPILRVNELPGFTFETCPIERLPRLAMRIMANDANTIARYATRSEVDWALMLSLVNKGLSFARIASLFESSRHESHLDSSRRDYLKRLEGEYMRARELPDTETFKAAREFEMGVRVWALNAHSITDNARTRETDRRVLLAHLDVVQRTGRMEWHMSQRDVERTAQMHPATVVKAHRRLQKARVIQHSQSAQTTYATKWTFGAGVQECITHTHSPGTVCVSDSLLHNATTDAYLTHSAFEYQGLGRHVARTFAAIVNVPLTETQIADVTGFHRTTVARHIERLAQFLLVSIRAGGRWQALPANLDDAAYALETAGIAKERERRIERERDAHKRDLLRGRKAPKERHAPGRKADAPTKARAKHSEALDTLRYQAEASRFWKARDAELVASGGVRVTEAAR